MNTRGRGSDDLTNAPAVRADSETDGVALVRAPPSRLPPLLPLRTARSIPLQYQWAGVIVL